jgi:hypothetical protein
MGTKGKGRNSKSLKETKEQTRWRSIVHSTDCMFSWLLIVDVNSVLRRLRSFHLDNAANFSEELAVRDHPAFS